MSLADYSYDLDAVHLVGGEDAPVTDTDVITDFKSTEEGDGENDTLDISQLLDDLADQANPGDDFDSTTDDVNDWAKLIFEGGSAYVQVDTDGTSGGEVINVVELQGVNLTDDGKTLQDYIDNGNITVDNS